MASAQTAPAPTAAGQRRRRYPPIESHGLIGDLQTAALVTEDGTIDWFCSPRFDSPSIFASLLDHDKGGYFQVAPDDADAVVRQLYLPDSAILVTRFMTEAGVGEVVDFMPIHEPEKVTDRHRIVRVIRSVRGDMKFRLECAPRFDYGRQTHVLEVGEHGATFRAPSTTLKLDATMPLSAVGRDVRAEFVLHQGEEAGVVLESSADGPARGVDLEQVNLLQNSTIDNWSEWLRRSTYQGRWRDMVQRSAMTLRLLIYAPTAAPVAAVTTGLPEVAGGERNWDYRYTWVRDASFSVYALLGLGYREEAVKFLRWIWQRIVDHSEGAPLQIMYRVDGTGGLDEFSLDHFEGWRGSRPVRIGNGAANQRQLDIYGELLDSIYHAHQASWQMGHQGWTKLNDVMHWLARNWDNPEEGIWETRGGQKNFTYGRLMTWVAMDRMVRMARDLGRPADSARLSQERDNVYRQIMERAWNPKKSAFTQHYDTDVLDASVLLMPLVGFIAPQDPMWQSTLEAIDDELVSDSLVYRYNPSASPDGLRGHEGTFSICTFWYVDALARSGRLYDARLVFQKMMTYANKLGLFSEEIGPTGEQLGNFPQAFSHLSLINAAINLDFQLDHGAGHVDVLRTAMSRPRAS